MEKLICFMRKLLSLLAVVSLLFSACKKDTEATIHTDIYGTWQWESSQGGIAGHTIKPSTNTTVIIKIKKDKTFTVEKNGVETHTGSFSITNMNSKEVLVLNQGGVALSDGAALYGNQLFSLQENKLYLEDHMITDGYRHTFK
jgi:hypothetical protein